jgi:ribonucleotide reductase alpha subunit
LRVALGIHGADLPRVQETYDLLSQKYFTHATPTLFNAGTNHPQLSSCYLIGMEDDSVDGIYNTLKDCAKISKWAGGIGLHVHNVRAAGTHINGTNGVSNGLVPMLRVFNTTARYIDQGGGRRSGSFAIYLEPWHADIEAFLDMRKNHGDEEMRARDLFYGLWIPDLFMTKVKKDEDWALFCPHKCPGLADCYGDAFNTLYETYCAAGKANKTIKARALWFKILDSQMETGTPYLLYKDPANQKSNQQNLGVIKSSNLCVAPETLILTEQGYCAIETLADQPEIKVWNGEEFSATVIRKTGSDQELLTVETSDGCTLDCTPYHKFYLQDGSTVEAQDLKENDTLLSCAAYPCIDGTQSYPVAIETVPLNAALKTKIDWLAYYYNTELYNTIILEEKLYLSHPSRTFLFQIKLMLQTCGLNAELVKTTLSCPMQPLIDLGFKSLRVNLIAEKRETERLPITIQKMFRTGRRADTYCFNEPKKHAGVFNGLLTGQCTEIIEYSDAEQTAVCNLASLGLSKFVTPADKTFDYAKLHAVTKVVTYNLNRIIDVNFYPTEKTRVSNLLHRPIGIGVQGLADVFALMDIAFTSEAARTINKLIFETIYHASLECSMEMAKERSAKMQALAAVSNQLFQEVDVPHLYEFKKEHWVSRTYTEQAALDEYVRVLQPIPAELYSLEGTQMGAYSSFAGSPASKGLLQFDLWGVTPDSGRYDWATLKTAIQTYGLRNSLLVAPMPTASTSQILGNNECFEPFTSNLYSRRTNAGEFVLPNKYLMAELIELGLWNEALKENIILNKGSVQQLTDLSPHLREKYKTVWEIPMKQLIDMAADRGPYICQSQSLNLWVEDPDYKSLTAMHFYAWQAGLKTGIYYLRRKAKHQAQQFTIRPQQEQKNEDCLMCSA